MNPIEKRHKQLCTRCRNHGLKSPRKGHKGDCRYLKCDCEKCKLTTLQQNMMAKAMGLRRKLKQKNQLAFEPETETHSQVKNHFARLCTDLKDEMHAECVFFNVFRLCAYNTVKFIDFMKEGKEHLMEFRSKCGQDTSSSHLNTPLANQSNKAFSSIKPIVSQDGQFKLNNCRHSPINQAHRLAHNDSSKSLTHAATTSLFDGDQPNSDQIKFDQKQNVLYAFGKQNHPMDSLNDYRRISNMTNNLANLQSRSELQRGQQRNCKRFATLGTIKAQQQSQLGVHLQSVPSAFLPPVVYQPAAADLQLFIQRQNLIDFNNKKFNSGLELL